jgi:hypothetical protein
MSNCDHREGYIEPWDDAYTLGDFFTALDMACPGGSMETSLLIPIRFCDDSTGERSFLSFAKRRDGIIDVRFTKLHPLPEEGYHVKNGPEG